MSRELNGEVQRALADVDATTAVYERTELAHREASAAAMAAALAALRVNASPAEVARRSPFEAAYLRRKARDAGIPPARTTKPKTDS